MSLFKAVIGGGVAAAVYFYAPGALEHEFFSCFQSEAFIKTAKPIAIAVGTALGVTAVVLGVAVLTLSAFYGTLIAGNAFNIDGYTGQRPTVFQKAQVVVLHYLNVGTHRANKTLMLPLEDAASPFVPNLRITSRQGSVPKATPFAPSNAIVVATIRMGFGHHRIAYAATSWALATNRTTYFHDLLNIESAEATLIKEMDKLYSKGSRMATELGGPVEKLWGALTKNGDENSLRIFYQMAEHLRPLMQSIPRSTPIITSHCFAGMLAMSLGFKHVINLVIDNYAQWFIVVPGAYNLVQGPSNYHNLLRMGVPADKLVLAGHWIPKDLVDNIEFDCELRKARARERQPLRILIPVGGAGAQKTFVTNFVKALKPHVNSGKVQLFLNAADHDLMRIAFLEAIKVIGADYTTVESMEGVHAFADRLRTGASPPADITLFTFKDYFPAVAATDVLTRVSDVLACKPSELAFYPVPKLMIRRVGDHEAYSAFRASELGDGTQELREVPEAMAYIERMEEKPDLLLTMNKCIISNKKSGFYDGCKNAVALATELAYDDK